MTDAKRYGSGEIKKSPNFTVHFMAALIATNPHTDKQKYILLKVIIKKIRNSLPLFMSFFSRKISMLQENKLIKL